MARPASAPRPWLASAMLLAMGGAMLACGPSFQAIYEGNARFEHCYALEENPQSPMRDKAACWRDWSERYTFGQTRDRIHYATARYVALSEAHDVPTDEALMMAAPGETPRRTTITTPTPTSAFAPPPKVLDTNENATTGTGLVGTTPSNVVVPVDGGVPPAPLPAATCSESCGGEYQRCNGGCSVTAGPTCQSACQASYRTCMRDCFK